MTAISLRFLRRTIIYVVIATIAMVVIVLAKPTRVPTTVLAKDAAVRSTIDATVELTDLINEAEVSIAPLLEQFALSGAPFGGEVGAGETSGERRATADVDEEWLSFPRSDTHPAPLFAKAAVGIDGTQLFRNKFLNPRDVYLAPPLRERIRDICRAFVAQISMVAKNHSETRHQILRELEDQQALSLVSRESLGEEKWRVVEEMAVALQQQINWQNEQLAELGVDASQIPPPPPALPVAQVIQNELAQLVPDAVAFLRTGDHVYVATRDQMSSLRGHEEYLAYLEECFYEVVLGFFKSCATITSSEVIGLRTAFQETRKS